MACEIMCSEGAIFILWGKPTSADFDRVIACLELANQVHGKPVVYVARVPANAPPPEGDARAHLNTLMPRFLQVCSSYHIVLEGSGFFSAVKRAILASLLQLGRMRSFFVHESVHGVVAKAAPDRRGDVEALLALAEARGWLTAQPPDGRAPAQTAECRPVEPRAGRHFAH